MCPAQVEEGYSREEAKGMDPEVGTSGMFRKIYLVRTWLRSLQSHHETAQQPTLGTQAPCTYLTRDLADVLQEASRVAAHLPEHAKLHPSDRVWVQD